MALGLAGVAAAAVPEKSGSALPAPDKTALPADLPPSADVVVEAATDAAASELQQQMAALVQSMQTEAVTEQSAATAAAIEGEGAAQLAIDPAVLAADVTGAAVTAAELVEPVLLAQAVVPAAVVTEAAPAAAASATAAGATSGAAAAGAGAAALSASSVLLAAAGIGLVAAVGSGSKDSGSSTSNKDTTAPAAPVINAVATDNIVNASEKTAGVTVTGTAEAGASVVVSWGTASKTVTATGGTWSASFSSAEVPADASTTISAVATDAAGNPSAAGTRAVKVDTVSTTPVVSAVAGDNTVNATEKTAGVTVTGTAEAGSSVVVSWGNASKTVTATDGTWSTSFSSAEVPADASTAISAVATDAFGNVSTAGTLAVTVDTVAPVITLKTATGATGTVVLTYDGPLDATNIALADNFTVTTGGENNPVTAVNVDGAVITLLVTPFAAGNMTVAYTDPTSGDDLKAIQDAAGNDAAGFSTGIVADGYVRGATVYIDTNNNGTADPGTDYLVGTTDAFGNFFIPTGAPTGTIIAVGGVNIDTGVPNTLPLKAPAGATTINPLTTMVQAVVDQQIQSGATLSPELIASASTSVATSLGLTAELGGVSLSNYDPISSGSVVAQKAAAQVATIVTMAENASAGAGASVISGIVAQISAAGNAGGTVNLADSNTISAVVKGALSNATAEVQALAQSAISDASSAISTAVDLTAISTAQSQALDKTPPSAPTVSVSSALTNSATPLVRVSFNTTASDGSGVVVGDTVKLLENGASVSATVTLVAADIVRGYVDLASNSLGDGSHALSAQLIDKAGNASATATEAQLTVDTVAPVSPIISTVAGDDVVSASEQTAALTGYAEAGSNVAIAIGGVTRGALAGADGAWTYNLTATDIVNLGQGNKIISVSSTDAAANVSAATTKAISVDTLAPTLSASITGANDNVTPLTGNIVSGGASNDNTPELSGTLSAALASGDVVAIYDGSVRLGLASVNGTSWAFTTAGLNNATHSFTARVEDAAGNAGVGSAAYSVVVNANVPAATLTILSSSLTNSTTPALTGTIVGTLAVGEVIRVFDGGNFLGNAITVGNGWSFSPPSALAQGVHNFSAVIENAGGNQGAVSSPVAVRIDTTAPAAPVIATIAGENAVSGTEKSAGVAVSGNAEPGSSLLVTWGDASKVVAAGSGGAWTASFLSSDIPADGDTTVSAASTDAAGNVGAATSRLVKVDTTGPSVTVSAVAVDNAINSAEANATVGVTVSGSTEAGAKVSLSFSGGNVRNLVANGDGAWTYALTKSDLVAMGQGAETLNVVARDASGNAGAAATQNITIDTLAPTLTPFGLDNASDTGVKGDGRSNVAAPTILFNGESNAAYAVEFINSAGVSTGFSDVVPTAIGAQLSLTAPSFSGGDGKYTVNLRATDLAGNMTLRTGTYTLDTAVASPVVNSVAADNTVNAAEKTAGVTVTGIAEAGASVVVSWGTASKTVTAAGGTWSTSFSSAEVPADASTTISAVATDVAGNASTAGARAVAVDTTISTPTVALTTDSGVSSSDKLTNNAALSLSTAAADVTRSVTVDGGAASANYVAPTSEGSHTVVVTDTDTAGNTAGASLTFTLDTTAPAKATITALDADGGATGDRLTNDNTPVISLTAAAGSKIFLGNNGSPVDAAKYSAVETSAGNYTVTVNQPLADGGYGVIVRDAAGNANTTFAQDGTDLATFRIDASAPTALGLTLASDTGTSTGDGITSSGLVNVTGLEAGATWQYSTDSGTSWTTGSGNSFTLSGDGAKSVAVRQTDVAGNVGSASTALAFTLDTTIATPTVPLTTDSGVSSSDKLTNNAALSLSTAAADVTRSVTVDGGAAGANYVAPTSEGSHTVVVTDTDTAGNTASASLTFTLDTTAPAKATITTIDADGGATGDRLTNDNTPVISLTATAGSRIFLGNNGSPVDAAKYSSVETSAGNYTVTVNQPLADGGYGVVVMDAAGNANTIFAQDGSDLATFRIDASAPLAIANITGATDNVPSTPTSNIAAGGITNDNTPTLQGTLTAALGAGEIVAVYDGANRLGTASVTGTAWQFTTAGLTNGNHSFSTRVEDAAGNIGQSASPYAIDVQTLNLDAANKVLFVGNSATFGRADPVLSYNTYDAVTNPTGVKDLTAPIAGTSFANLTGSNLYEPHPWGGVAGLFDAFAQQLGIDYDVSMSTRNAATLLGHYSNTSPSGSTEKWDLRGNIASQKWEMVVLQDQTDEPLPSGTGSITFAAGSSVAQLVIKPTADTAKEYDETLSIRLAANASYQAGTTASLVGTISNDDPTGPIANPALPTVTLSTNPGAVLENGTGRLVYLFTRTGDTSADLVVNFSTARDGNSAPSVGNSSTDFDKISPTTGTATSIYLFESGSAVTTGTASFGTNATGGTGTITIKAGQTTATLTLSPTDDATQAATDSGTLYSGATGGGDESLYIALTSNANYNVGTVGKVSATIINDDFAAGAGSNLPNITLALTSAAGVYENANGDLVYTFTRSGDATSQLTVNFDVTGTATYFASDATKSDFAVSTSGASGYTLKTTGGANADIGAFQKYANLIEDYIHTGAADSTTISGTTIAANPNADANTDVYLYQTWARPDMVVGNFDMLTNKVLDTVSGGYTDGTITKSDTQGAGYYLRLEDMSADLAAAYNGLAAANPDFDGAAPVATAFMNAVLNGTAIRDPYTETAGNGKVNLWFDDNLHASKHGSYLAGLTLFGTMTGIDPRALGGSDKVAADLGIDSATALALQTVASATLGLNQSYIWSKPGTVTELGDGTSATLATAGGFGFADSASAVHTVSVVPGQGALGTLTASIRSDGSTGQVNWLYTVNNQTIDPLLAFGQQRTETFTVTVGSGNGGTVSKTVTVNLLGTSTLQGTAGPDSLIGSVGNDTILGLAGDDSIGGGLGNDVIDGGDGTDWAGYSTAASAVNVNLTTNLATGGGGNDTLIRIENVNGTGFDDTITGNGAANRLSGNNGNDEFVGNGGNDTISGGDGSDRAGYLVANTGSAALTYAWDFTANAVLVNQGATALAKITAGATAGSWTVQDLANATATGFGTDTLSSIESLTFDLGTGSTTTSALTITSAQLAAAMPGDTVAPTLTLASPSDNSTAVAVGSNIVLTFSEAITAGSGNIVISNGSDTRTISIADASQVSISGAQLTLNPTAELLSGSNYNVQLASGVVRDVVGNAFAGINDATTLNFATAAQSTVTKIDWTSDQNGLGAVQGDTLYFQAHFTNPVLVTGSPQLSLQIINDAGVSHTVLATFEQYSGMVAGSTQNSMQFKYTLVAGDTGHYHLGDISLNGGTITESSTVGGLAADLTLNSGNKTITAGTYLFGAPLLGTAGTDGNDALMPYEANPTTAPTNGVFAGVDGGAGEFDVLVVPVLLPAGVTTAAVANTYTLKYSTSAATVTAVAADGTVAATVSVPSFPTNVEVLAFHAVFKDATNAYLDANISGINLSKNLITVNDAITPNEHYVQGSIGADAINLAGDTDTSARYLVRGGPGADTITGSSGKDAIKGDGGNNLINAGAGNDAIFVGTGTDTVDGGSGSDKVVITLDGQVLDIGSRINGFALQSLTGTWGNNGFTTTATANVYRVLTDDTGLLTVKNFSNGTTAMTATNVESIEVRLEQSDVRTAIPLIFGDSNANSLTGTGSSIVNGAAGNDTLTASNNGKDVLFGGSGNDTLIGGTARDLMYGGGGDDNMTGNAGNDWFVGNEGNDIISGGDGTDGAAYSLANAVTTALGYAWDATSNAVLVNQGATALAKITAGATAGSWTVQDLANATASGFGTDTLSSIESLTFDLGTGSTTTSVLTITSAQLAAAVPGDTVAPTLAISPPDIITNGVGVFNFTFSEAVTGFDANDIVVIGGTPAPGTFAGSGATYTMAITPTPSTTPVAFSINVAGGAASDLAGNASIVAAPLTASLLFGTAGADVLTVNGDKNIVYLGAGNDTVKLATAAGSTVAATDDVMDFMAGDKIDVSALLGALTGGAGYTGSQASFLTLENGSVTNSGKTVKFSVMLNAETYNNERIEGLSINLGYDYANVSGISVKSATVKNPDGSNFLTDVTDVTTVVPTWSPIVASRTTGVIQLSQNFLDFESSGLSQSATHLTNNGKAFDVTLTLTNAVTSFNVAFDSDFNAANAVVTPGATAAVAGRAAAISGSGVAALGQDGRLEIIADAGASLVTPSDNQLHFLTTFADGMTRLQMQYDTNSVFGGTHFTPSSIIAMDFDGDVRALLVPANMNFI